MAGGKKKKAKADHQLVTNCTALCFLCAWGANGNNDKKEIKRKKDSTISRKKMILLRKGQCLRRCLQVTY